MRKKKRRIYIAFFEFLTVAFISFIVGGIHIMGMISEDSFKLIYLVLFILFLNKDFLSGKSIIKRLFGYKIVKIDNTPANELQCFLRNLLILIYPIEVLFILLNPNRRLGDIIFGTKLIQLPLTNTSIIQDLKVDIKSFTFSVFTLITFLMSSIVFFMIIWFLSSE